MIVETDRLFHAFLPQTSGLKMAGQMRKETDRQTEEEVKRKLRVRERRHTLTMTTTTTTTSKDDCCQTKKENSIHASLF
jgi:cyclophilin family peptidyl-prolyl cis-trans isomerase